MARKEVKKPNPRAIARTIPMCQFSAMGISMFYSGTGLDRAAAQRRDEEWIARQLHDRSSRIVPVWRGHNLILAGSNPSALTLTGDHSRGLLEIAGEIALLGLDGATAFFAADLSDHEMPVLAPIIGRGEFSDIREYGMLLDRGEAALLAYARGLLFWHQRHRYCGICGGPTAPRQGGHVRVCGTEECGAEHFPRTDPAVIMLVTRPGPEGGAALLGRQARWPQGMMSTLAGFVDPGESLEEAVAREVMEESGIEVTDVQYQASQPWPFPSSLMLGFRARAKTVHINIDPNELEDARWFTRAQISEFGKSNELRLPRTDSIARWLIDGWLREPF